MKRNGVFLLYLATERHCGCVERCTNEHRYIDSALIYSTFVLSHSVHELWTHGFAIAKVPMWYWIAQRLEHFSVGARVHQSRDKCFLSIAAHDQIKVSLSILLHGSGFELLKTNVGSLLFTVTNLSIMETADQQSFCSR